VAKRRERKDAQKQRRALAQRDARGRVHLELHRDPAGNEYVALRAPLFEHEFQNELATGAANTAHGILRGTPSLEGALELARNAMAATSRIAEALLAQAPPGSVACRAGCDHCCYQVVGVTPPEGLAIVDELRRTRTSEQLGVLTAHVTELDEKARGLGSSARFSPDFPCPLLDVPSGRCTVYEVRPLSCRGMNSLDANECATRLRDPAARAEFLASGFGGHSYLEPIRAFHAISAGVQLGVSELYRLDMRPLELTAALRVLLTGPGSVAEAWLRGEQPFASARSSDLSQDPAMRAVSGRLGETEQSGDPP
jgi:Fe-S-cluster containining protein